MTVQQILVKQLGALPAIREYLERLQLKSGWTRWRRCGTSRV